MGLLHSNADGNPYADRSGYMGSGYTDSSKPRKCFNGYHSHHFGWYADKEVKVDPVSKGQLIRLATFVDYDKAASNEDVLINVSDKFFLEYNVAKGFNLQTEQKQNMVTVTEPLSTGTESRAGLDVGQTYDYPNYLGSGKTLKIKACRKESGGGLGADVMIVSIAMNTDLCNTNIAADRGKVAAPASSTSVSNSGSNVGSTGTPPPRPPPNAPKSALIRWLVQFIAWVRKD